MAYGRQMIMDNLRKAGTAFLDMDERYAKALEDRLPVNPNPVQGFGGLGRVVPIREHRGVIPVGSDYEFRGGHGPKEFKNHIKERMFDHAILGANIASRYALPAGGVTLAGKGLYDLTQGLYASASATPVFGGPEDGAQPGQLPL
jgi:hypothetical protein